MTLLHNELARRDNGRLELRPAPVRVRWNLDDLVTSDGHKLHCAFTCSVRESEENSSPEGVAWCFQPRSSSLAMMPYPGGASAASLSVARVTRMMLGA